MDRGMNITEDVSQEEKDAIEQQHLTNRENGELSVDEARPPHVSAYAAKIGEPQYQFKSWRWHLNPSDPRYSEPFTPIERTWPKEHFPTREAGPLSCYYDLLSTFNIYPKPYKNYVAPYPRLRYAEVKPPHGAYPIPLSLTTQGVKQDDVNIRDPHLLYYKDMNEWRDHHEIIGGDGEDNNGGIGAETKLTNDQLKERQDHEFSEKKRGKKKAKPLFGNMSVAQTPGDGEDFGGEDTVMAGVNPAPSGEGASPSTSATANGSTPATGDPGSANMDISSPRSDRSKGKPAKGKGKAKAGTTTPMTNGAAEAASSSSASATPNLPSVSASTTGSGSASADHTPAANSSSGGGEVEEEGTGGQHKSLSRAVSVAASTIPAVAGKPKMNGIPHKKERKHPPETFGYLIGGVKGRNPLSKDNFLESLIDSPEWEERPPIEIHYFSEDPDSPWGGEMPPPQPKEEYQYSRAWWEEKLPDIEEHHKGLKEARKNLKRKFEGGTEAGSPPGTATAAGSPEASPPSGTPLPNTSPGPGTATRPSSVNVSAAPTPRAQQQPQGQQSQAGTPRPNPAAGASSPGAAGTPIGGAGRGGGRGRKPIGRGRGRGGGPAGSKMNTPRNGSTPTTNANTPVGGSNAPSPAVSIGEGPPKKKRKKVKTGVPE